MIPSIGKAMSNELKIETQPSKNYKMHINHEVINGKCDGLEAMVQVIYKILNTERYQHIIYSWNYGIETIDLYGEPVNYVCSELQRRIAEALLQDDRISSVDSFEFDVSKRGVIQASFVVHTVFGDVKSEKVVNI